MTYIMFKQACFKYVFCLAFMLSFILSIFFIPQLHMDKTYPSVFSNNTVFKQECVFNNKPMKERKIPIPTLFDRNEGETKVYNDFYDMRKKHIEMTKCSQPFMKMFKTARIQTKNGIYADVQLGTFPSEKDRSFSGDWIVFMKRFSNVHAHILIDHFPGIAILREMYPKSFKFLLYDAPLLKKMLTWLDPNFVLNRVVWLKNKELVQIQGRLSFLEPNPKSFNTRYAAYSNALRRWIQEVKGPKLKSLNSSNNKRSLVLYLSRSAGAGHARKVNPLHQKDIIHAIRLAMKKHHKTEKLVVFTGVDKNNTPISLEEQFDLFTSAETLIGPHGGAFANIMWMGLLETERRPNVLEFLIGPESHQVQPSKSLIPFRKTFYTLFNGASWVNYYHVLYAPNSTHMNTYINLQSFNDALDNIWE
mmetsp:Transcript_444/g.1024  ORF Transcript_444/g.1024 Transcript_444/m.1024 type:complete len:418 (+) Transcript_444:303-1556(+)